MKKVVRILLAILMVAALALGITACKSECQKGNHVFTGEENVVTAATCETDGIKTVKCVNCDQTKEVTIPKLGHDYTGANWSPCEDDETQHQRTCVRSGCGHVEKAPHSFVEGVCVCGKTEGTSSCNHANKYLASTTSATCISAKVEHWACHDCDWTEDKTVGEPLGHDYAGAEWHADGNTHYQVCKRDGCDEHNSHAADMSTTWTPCADDETQHQKTCSHEGCGIVEKAAHGSVTVPGTPATCTEDGRRNGTKCPDCNKVLQEGEVITHKGHNFATDWTHDQENGKHYHACLNEGCTARDSETECDYVYGAAQTNATQHWGVCSVCGNQSKPENHNSNTVLPAEDAKCYKDGKTEGKACSVCSHIMQAQETISKDTVKHSWVWVYGDDRDDSHTDVDHYQKCSVAECGAITNAGAHALHMTQGDDDQHWEACQCGYVDESSKENHVWEGEDGFACPTCGKVAPGVYLAVAIDGETTVHRLGETGTLQQAVNLVGEGKTATIYLGHDLSGSGVIVPSGRNITFRFNNHTYTVTDNLVGSSGTETNGFQLLKGSNITFINANIVAQNASMYILVQNYANLTLDHVNLDAGNSSVTYVLSNNNGNILIKNDTKITAPANKYAFDVYYNLDGNYPDGVSVTVESGCLITGAIGYGGEHLTEGWQSKTLISLPNADKNYNIKLQQGLGLTCESVGITIAGNRISHKEGAGKVTVPATCHSKGETSYCCTVCGKVMRTEEIGMSAHSWNAGEVTTAATCTEKGERTYTCTNDGCGETRTEEIAALGHDWQTKWTFDENNTTVHEHWHACNRCDERKDVGDCHAVTIIEAQDVTCTVDGRTEGVECDICKKTIKESTVIKAQGHVKGTEYVITDAGHQVKCSVCGEVTGDPVAHKYVDGVCECGREITVAEIKALYDAGAKNSNGTFKLEGKVKAIDIAYDSGYKNITVTLEVTENGKTYEFYCFRIADANGIVGSDIQVDDIIAFNGCSVDVFKGTKEIVNGKLTKHQLATYSITHNDVDDLTVNGLPSSAQRGDKVEFTVEYDHDRYVLTVEAGGKEIAPVNGTYSFDVTGDVNVVFSMLDNTVTNPHKNNGELTLTQDNIPITNSYISSETTKTLTINGADITFGWRNIYKSAGFQFNSSKTGNVSDLYNKNSIIGLKSIKLVNVSGSGTLVVTVAKDEAFTQTEILNGVDGVYTVPAGYTYFKVAETAKKAGKVESIVIVAESTCSNTNFTEVDLTELGITDACNCEGHAVFYKCTECGAYFSDELKNVKVSEDYIKEHYTKHDKATEWSHGKETIDGQEVFAHWHACANCDVKLDLTACVGEVKADTAVSATCTTAGKEADKVCKDCGQTVEVGVQISALGHDYTYTPATDSTHNATCSRCDSKIEGAACTAAADAEWHYDGTEHWKLCVCGNKVDGTEHLGDTCECGAIKLSVVVVDEDDTAIADHDVQTTFPAYAKVGDEIEVTVSSQRFEIIMIVSGDNSFELAEGTNNYVGIVAEGGVITVYASKLTSAQYKGVTPEGDVVVAVTLGESTDELAENAVLAEGNILNITVMYDPDEVDVKVTVTQGSNSVDVKLGEYDSVEGTATATYECAALGDVTITVTATKRATITVIADNATVTVTQNDASVIGKSVSVGSKVNVTIAANEGYVVESKVITGATGPENNADGEYTVTGDMTITVTVVKLVTVNISAVTGAEVTVKTESDQTVADGIAVPAGTKLIISVNVTDGTQQVASVKLGETPLTANTDGNYEGTISRDWSADEISINISLKDKPAEETSLATALFGSTYNSKNVSSYANDWSSTNNDFTVNIVNFNNNNSSWSYIKAGSKGGTSVASIATANAISGKVTKVVLTIDAITATSINSITLLISDSSDFSNATTVAVNKSKGEQEITVPEEIAGANKYYKLVFDCAKASSNGTVQVSKVEFKGFTA